MYDTRRVYAGIADLAQRGDHIVLGFNHRFYDRDRYLFFPAETRDLVPLLRTSPFGKQLRLTAAGPGLTRG